MSKLYNSQLKLFFKINKRKIFKFYGFELTILIKENYLYIFKPQRSKEIKLNRQLLITKKIVFLWVKINLLKQLNVVGYEISQTEKEKWNIGWIHFISAENKVDKLLSEALCKTEDKKLFLHSLVCAKQK